MHQTLKDRLKPVLIIALFSLLIPPLALARAELGPDRPSASRPAAVAGLLSIPSAAALLDLKDSLALAYREQSLERLAASIADEVQIPNVVPNALRRAPAGAVAAKAIQHPSGGGTVSPSGADWYAIAMCESSGNWAANTGNGFWGGLQFTPSTWFAYGGGPFDGVGPFPYSSSEQIAVGERVLAGQGPGAWPNCFQLL